MVKIHFHDFRYLLSYTLPLPQVKLQLWSHAFSLLKHGSRSKQKVSWLQPHLKWTSEWSRWDSQCLYYQVTYFYLNNLKRLTTISSRWICRAKDTKASRYLVYLFMKHCALLSLTLIIIKNLCLVFGYESWLKGT